MIFRFAAISFLVLMISCNQQTKPAGRDAQLSSQMLEIKKMFGAGNWRFTEGGDTSYFFFSPKPGLFCDVYHYSIRNGDSINSELRKIYPQDDSITWEMNKKEVRLLQAGKGKLVWNFQREGKKILCELLKVDSTQILYRQNGEPVARFDLTIPFASFLARAKYDYLHGTHYTDSLEIKSSKGK